MLSYDVETINRIFSKMNKQQVKWIRKHIDSYQDRSTGINLDDMNDPRLFSSMQLEWAGFPEDYMSRFMEADERIPNDIRAAYEEEKAVYFGMSIIRFVEKYHQSRFTRCYQLLEKLLSNVHDMPLIIKHMRPIIETLKTIPESAFECDYDWSKRGLDALDECLETGCKIEDALKHHKLGLVDIYTEFFTDRYRDSMPHEVTLCHSYSIIKLILALAYPDHAPALLDAALEFSQYAQKFAGEKMAA